MATTKKTAAETYAKHAADISALLDWIGDELDVHEERAAKEPGNWGFPGDLGHVRAKLRETLAFLSGVEERVIDEELEELRA